MERRPGCVHAHRSTHVRAHTDTHTCMHTNTLSHVRAHTDTRAHAGTHRDTHTHVAGDPAGSPARPLWTGTAGSLWQRGLAEAQGQLGPGPRRRSKSQWGPRAPETTKNGASVAQRGQARSGGSGFWPSGMNWSGRDQDGLEGGRLVVQVGRHEALKQGMARGGGGHGFRSPEQETGRPVEYRE